VKDYELILIFDPKQGEEKILSFVAKMEEKIKGLGGTVSRTDKWGTRNLASMMGKAKTLTQGYYVMIKFQSPPAAPAELKALLKVSEQVVRYFLSLEVVVAPPRVPERKEIAGAPLGAVAVGEIKGAPLGEPK
jgi:small subunit ribosomal protein S6